MSRRNAVTLALFVAWAIGSIAMGLIIGAFLSGWTQAATVVAFNVTVISAAAASYRAGVAEVLALDLLAAAEHSPVEPATFSRRPKRDSKGRFLPKEQSR